MANSLTGYTDRLSARPGETLTFMVSTSAAEYRADIVRLIHGDPQPAGPGFKEQVIGAEVDGTYPGRNQRLFPGSYVEVPDKHELRQDGSFTLWTWIYPTLPGVGRQVIMSKISAEEQRGYALFVDHTGTLALQLGNGPEIQAEIFMPVPLLPRRWQWVASRYEAESGRVTLSRGLHSKDISLSRVDQTTSTARVAPGTSDAPLRIAATGGTNGRPTAFFNGKIADPCLFARALLNAEIEQLAEPEGIAVLAGQAAACWDFSQSISSDHIVDRSPYGAHGRSINMPMRAVTGPHWNGDTDRFTDAPVQYNAIHFHEDDLEDAGWTVGFSFTLPAGMPSGIYAARLRADDLEDHLPFLVCPPKGTATAPLAFLLPTYTYIAYANEMVCEKGLNCLYDHHSDGSGMPYASVLHPMKNIRPKRGNLKSTDGNLFCRHLSADLYFTDWLEAMGHTYDIITDQELANEGVALLTNYATVVTGSHPEYVSGAMLDGFESYLNFGGRLMYLGGNGFYWVTTQAPDKPHVIEVRRPNGSRPWISEPGEGHHSSTGEMGGLWRYRGRTPQRLVGVGFTAQGWTPDDTCGSNRAYARTSGSFDSRATFVFEGIGADEAIGDFLSLGLGPGAAGDELDRADAALGTPDHALLLASATGFSSDFAPASEEQPWLNSTSTASDDALIRADMVYFETPNGGAVFSVGSISWMSCLSYNGYDNTVSQVTSNVLHAFLSGAHSRSIG